MRVLYIALVTAALLASLLRPSAASTASMPAAVEQRLPDAMLVGSGTLEVLFFDVFDASLYAPSGQFRSEQPFALTLQYRRALKGRDIVARTLKEMRRQGMNDEATLSAWGESLTAIFPDVTAGTRLTGFSDFQGYTQFFHNEEPVGAIQDVEFTRRFFAIWLGEDTSEPGLRQQLLAGMRGQGG